MASILRSAKSGNDWTSNELQAYNITVRNQSAKQFFGKDLPDTLDLENIDSEFFNADVASEVANDDTNHLLGHLYFATRANSDQESAVDDFMNKLLYMLDFEERGFALRSCYRMPLSISRDPTQMANSNICLIHRTTTTILLIIDDKTVLSDKNPEPQVIAEAIAAFQTNNHIRVQLGLQKKESMAIPCITMIGTRPTFYVVPVTEQLNMAVKTGDFPKDMTEVRKCMVHGGRWLADGMDHPDFRVEALKHFVLFHPMAKSLWLEFLTDLYSITKC